MRAAGEYDQRAIAAYTRADNEVDYYFQEHGINSTEAREAFRTDLELKIDKELNSLPTNVHTVIISSEHFHSTVRTDRAMKKLQTLLKKYFQNFKVICYLREQGAMCTSWYSTALKSGLCRTLEAFTEKQCRPQNYYFNYEQLLSRWAGSFGQGSVDLAIYDKSEFLEGDLLKDFTYRIDPTLLGQLKPYEQQANQSLSPEGQRLLLGVNCAFPRTQGGAESIRVLCREEIYNLLKGRGRQLDLPTRKSIYESFLESNTKVQETYFPNRKALFPVPDTDVPIDEEFSKNGRRALDRVLQVVRDNGSSLLGSQYVKEAQQLIEDIYLGHAGIPFDWGNVSLFGKGLIKANRHGVMHASLVIRNTSTEPLEFSEKPSCHYSIGWRLMDKAGNQLDKLCGNVQVEKVIPPGTFRLVSVAFRPDIGSDNIEKACFIEFSFIERGKWLNEEHPLNSAWALLV